MPLLLANNKQVKDPMIKMLRRRIDLLLQLMAHPVVEDKVDDEVDNEESSESSSIVEAAGSSEGRSSARESKRWRICLSSLFMMDMLHRCVE